MQRCYKNAAAGRCDNRLTMQRRVEEDRGNGHVGLQERALVGHDRPRELVLACDRVNVITKEMRRTEVVYVPWSCSASGAVAARRREMRRTLPMHENPYLDSDRIATP